MAESTVIVLVFEDEKAAECLFDTLEETLKAGYPKVWPFPTKRLATSEKTGESALQGSSRSLTEIKLLPTNFVDFVTRTALQANLPMWPTFW